MNKRLIKIAICFLSLILLITADSYAQNIEEKNEADKTLGREVSHIDEYGNKYYGELKNGELDGEGVLVKPDGSKYEGEFKDGKPNGEGSFMDKDGSIYKGKFKYGLLEEVSVHTANPESKDGKENVDHIAFFNIPLDATLRKIAEVLSKTEIFIYRGAHRIRVDYIDQYKDALIGKYKSCQLLDEEAIKVLDEKFNFFSFKLRDKFYYLTPSVFWCLINPTDSAYPIFETFYNSYNSQFYLICKNLPKEMTSNGVKNLSIYFDSIDGNEPRSSMICITFSLPNEKLITNLTEKYGQPKLYYGQLSKSEEFRKGLLEDLKKAYPNNEELHSDDLIYGGISESIVLDESIGYPSFTAPFRGWGGDNIGFGRYHCTLEWASGDNRILLLAIVNGKEKLVPDRLRLSRAVYAGGLTVTPYLLYYINLPNLKNSAMIYNELIKESDKKAQEIQSRGEDKF